MGKPYKRLKYDLPENYKANDMIGRGEAVSTSVQTRFMKITVMSAKRSASNAE